jgi:hypothetical protein
VDSCCPNFRLNPQGVAIEWSDVYRGVEMFNSLVGIVAHALSWLFVIGILGTVFLVIPTAAYQLFSVLFEKDRPDERDPILPRRGIRVR